MVGESRVIPRKLFSIEGGHKHDYERDVMSKAIGKKSDAMRFLEKISAATSTNIMAFLVRDPGTIIGQGPKRRKDPPERNR
jgi:hypothetical protein